MLFDLSSQATPTLLGTVTANDATYNSGLVGMYTYDNSSGGLGSVDTTFDNYKISARLPSADEVNEAIDSTDPAGPVTLLDGTYDESVNVNVNVELKGTATITGSLDVTSPQGVVSPGDGPGFLVASNLAMTDGSKLRIELNGAAPGSEHDQMIISSTVAITDAVLDATLGYSPTAGEQFVIVDNQDADAVIGTFAGLPEGAQFNIGATPFTITYVGGDGNDIMLTAGAGAPSVAGRHIFYNFSKFDGNNAAASAADDAAIATDKTALLPGGTAAFANYTSYIKGINGVMVDIAGLPGNVSASDFAFKVGNNNAPASWVNAPAPSSVSVRAGAGVGGSSRVTILWSANAQADAPPELKKTWLQVTVLANANTGLSASDVFYFGNAIGEVGNSTTNAQVSAADEALIRLNGRNALNPAPVDFRYDINRDGLVAASDQALCRLNATNAFTALRLIVVPAAAGGGGSAALDAALADAELQVVSRRRRR
jgi:hypothetical protein